jgi:hypothetical protein
MLVRKSNIPEKTREGATCLLPPHMDQTKYGRFQRGRLLRSVLGVIVV